MTSPLVAAVLGGKSAAELLSAVADDGALCEQADADLFIGPDGFESPRQLARRESAAKAICRSCPAIDSCLAYALEIRPMHGVWAGMSVSELHALDRQGVA